MSVYKRKTWSDKLHNPRTAQVEVIDKDFAGIRKGQRMLIPTPLLIDAYVRQIPFGKAIDSTTLRRDLAAESDAEVTCPLTTGIFLRIVAEAAYEQYQNDASVESIAPFWRAISLKSPTAKKLTFGTSFLTEQRAKEGLI